MMNREIEKKILEIKRLKLASQREEISSNRVAKNIIETQKKEYTSLTTIKFLIWIKDQGI